MDERQRLFTPSYIGHQLVYRSFQAQTKIKVKQGGTQTATRMKTDAEYNREKRANEAAINTILDKIKQRGYESLSADEKRELFDRSKRN